MQRVAGEKKKKKALSDPRGRVDFVSVSAT